MKLDKVLDLRSAQITELFSKYELIDHSSSSESDSAMRSLFLG